MRFRRRSTRFTRFLAYRWRIRGIDGWYLAYRWRPLAETRHLGGHACYPLTIYCPNRPATYKRDTTGRPAESAIYKPDIQPKPRPHAYTHAYTGTPARPHPRLHRHTRTPTTTQVPLPAPPYAHDRARTGKIASHERKGASKASETGRITPPSAHRQAKPAQLTSREQKERTQHQNSPKHPESYPHPLTTHASARFRPYAHRNNTPAQHQTCTRTQTQVHTLKRNTYHKHTNTTHHIPSTTRRTPPHTGEAMSPACGGARLDTTPEHQTNGARRPRRTTRAAQSRSVAIAARAPQKRSQPQT